MGRDRDSAFVQWPCAGQNGTPILVRVAGDASAVDALAAKAAGNSDLPPLDFLEWARDLEPRVRGGLDPIEIEAKLFDVLRRHGDGDPARSLARTWHHARGGPGEHRPEGGLIFPRRVVDPAATPRARREAFSSMIADCERERRERQERFPHLDAAPSSPVEPTPFSLVSLLPLPSAELVPTWAGRHDPGRRGVKLEAWGGYSGLLHAKLEREAPGTLKVIGLAEARDTTGHTATLARGISLRHGVEVEITGWGEVWRASPGEDPVLRRTSTEGFVVGVAEKHGVRSVDELAQILKFDRHDRATACMADIRANVLRPGAMETAWRAFEASAVEALALKDRVAAMPRRVSRALGSLMPRDHGDHDAPPPPRM